MYFTTNILTDLIDYANAKGVDAWSLENEFSGLKKGKYINYDTVVKILNHIGQELNDECLGLHIGEQISLKATAEVDQIMQNSETLETSFKNAVEYSKLISDALECSLIKNEDSYAVIFEENPNWKIQQTYAKRQILDLTVLCCLKSLIAYTNQSYCPSKISFHSEKPKNLNEYYRLFNCRLRFNQSKTEIIFEKQIFDKHSKTVEFGLLENLKEKTSIEIESLNTENELIYRLKKCILNHKPQRLKVEEASLQLNMSKRTMQRKLNSLKTNFKAIEYELQLKLSKTYLEEQQKSIEEISYLLGFSESSAFIRFFKSLTAQTPSEYIKAIGANRQ